MRRRPRSAAFPLPVWNWSALQGDGLREAWRDLGEWVAWLVATYDLGDWWSWHCWWRHPEVVAWLIPLREWHRTVYTPELVERPADGRAQVEPTSARSAVEWHTAGLRPTVDRLSEALRHCGREHAQPSEISQEHEADAQRSGMLAFGRFVEEASAMSTEVPTT